MKHSNVISRYSDPRQLVIPAEYLTKRCTLSFFEIHHVSRMRSTKSTELGHSHCDLMIMNISLIHRPSVRYRLETVTAKWQSFGRPQISFASKGDALSLEKTPHDTKLTKDTHQLTCDLPSVV